jgi:hypothetical protein
MIKKITTASLLSLLIISQAAADEKVTIKRKPGLWEVSVSADGKSLPGSMKQCADEATDAQMMQMAQGQSESCKMGELRKIDSGYEFSSECKMGPSTITSQGVFKGDFETSYTGEVVTKMTPPVFGRGEAKSTIQAKWLGDCPADMKPGDMQTGDGMKIGLDQAKKGAQMAAEMMKNPEMLKAMKDAMAGAAEAQGALKGLGEMVAGGK